LPKHGPNLVLHAQKHTQHIRVEDGLIALGGHIGSRTGSAHGASVIDCNVEATETRPQCRVYAVQWLASVVSTGNNDPRSFMREGQSSGTTDARQCAGN
jgi:hypothetical protein